MIAVNWSFVENSLDSWAASAFSSYGGNQIEKEMPRQFSRKVKFLRKCFNRLPGLSPFAAHSTAILERATALADTRHYVIHGVLAGFIADEDETFVFRKIDISDDKQSHVLGELRIPGRHLIMAGNELLVMASHAQQISARILNAIEQSK